MTEFFSSRFTTIKQYLATQQFPTSDWKNLFSGDFWIQPLSGQSPYYLFGIILTLAALIGLEAWRRYLKRLNQQTPLYQVPLNHLSNLFYYLLVLLAGYWFFRSQQIAFVSSRLFLLGVLVVALIWLAWIGAYLRRRLPVERRSYLEQERFFRYLPNTKPKTSPKRAGK